jgi:RimJ/RimL family protein N-acetyltransferase
MTRVAGKRVTLRGFRSEEFDRLLAAAQAAPIGDGIHWGPREPDAVRKKISASGAWHEGWIEFGVEADGRVVGEVQARCVPRAMPPGVFELGVEIYDEADRRDGLGGEAVREITRFLFRDEGAIRVQVATDVDNDGMRRLSERLGFGFEGVMRGYMPTSKGPRDYAIYAMTRNDYQEEKNGWI